MPKIMQTVLKLFFHKHVLQDNLIYLNYIEQDTLSGSSTLKILKSQMRKMLST